MRTGQDGRQVAASAVSDDRLLDDGTSGEGSEGVRSKRVSFPFLASAG